MPRLKPEHMVYVRTMGKVLRVTAMFDSDDDANDYMTRNKDEGVVAVVGDNTVLIANLYDKGIKVDPSY